MQTQLPEPADNELPTHYADRVGQWYLSRFPEHQKQLGQFLTTVEVAAFMAHLCTPVDAPALRLLDPGAGTGILSCALCESLVTRIPRLQEIDLEAYEIDTRLAGCLSTCLDYARRWLQVRGVKLSFKVRTEDFVMSQADALDSTPRLFSNKPEKPSQFDIVITNPPYFKIQKADPRAKAAAAVVHGQPNIYALFMAVAAVLVKPGGVLAVISPRSYTAGPYFRRFREQFFAKMRPEIIHLFNSRRAAFRRDDVLQENIILLARRCDDWYSQANGEVVTLSASANTHALINRRKREVPLLQVLDFSSRDKVIRVPITDEDEKIAQLVDAWRGTLHAYGLEISTGPVVPFRATSLLCDHAAVSQEDAPLLWMQNVTAMQVQWPVDVNNKAQYIRVNTTSLPLLIADKNYVLLRRFSAKEQRRRLTAAPLLQGQLGSPFIGVENHLNYIHRPGGSLTSEEAYGLAALLNSRLLDTYFRIYNGNTQVSATELRAMPLPPLEMIVRIGRQAMALQHLGLALDKLVEDALCFERCANGEY